MPQVGTMVRLLPSTLLAATLCVLFGASALRADGSWLDLPLVAWNVPGAPVPAAPQDEWPSNNDYCATQAPPRAPETAEDDQVVNAGWNLFGASETGWGETIVRGTVGYDGMCRPMGYQVFVFDNGVFAGTISPVPMNSRLDGSGNATINQGGDGVTATFERYADTDPFCCPSRMTLVEFSLDEQQGLPVLVPQNATTSNNG